MTDLENLLRRARADQEIRRLPPEAFRGAELYFRSYEYVAFCSITEDPEALRDLAADHVSTTVVPLLTPRQQQAADTARDVLKRLS